jgi:hypothetical protein
VTEVAVNKQLNLVIEAENSAGDPVYFHSRPISREMFRANWQAIGVAFNKMFEGGMHPNFAPRIARFALDDAVRNLGLGSNDVIEEIRRNTLVIVPRSTGSRCLPLDVARAHVDEETIDQAENVITYFTLASAMHMASMLRLVRETVLPLWGSRTTSSSAMEFAASLPTSTQTDSTAGTIAPPTPPPRPRTSSVPS